MKIRLHKLLTQDLTKFTGSEYTKAEIQRNIENYGVKINGLVTFNRLEWTNQFDQISLENWPKRIKSDFSKIQILREDFETLLIFKPPGIVVEKGAGHQADSLVNWLQQKFSKNSFFKTDKGPVHRLDKESQGLILIAKTQDAFDFLQNQFRNRSVKKEYLTILNGKLEKNILIQNWQTRDRQNIIRQKFFWDKSQAKKYDIKARFSKSIFYPISFCKELNLSLAKVRIFTGRTHQIRLQAEALGYALWGDKVYHINNNQISIQNLNLFSSQKDKLQTFFPAKPIPNISKTEFKKLQTKLFLPSSFYLLSNLLELQLLTGEILCGEWKGLKNVSGF